MALYKEHWLSLVAFCNEFAANVATDLGITAPVFVNLDLHGNLGLLPKADYIGLINYAWHDADKIVTVFTGIGISTYDDTDNLRHIDIMDKLVDLLKPTTSLPVYKVVDDVVVKASWMVIQSGVAVEPIMHNDVSSLQVVSLRLLSGGGSATP